MRNIWLFFKRLFKNPEKTETVKMTTERLRKFWGDEPLPYENSDRNDRYLWWLYLNEYLRIEEEIDNGD